MALTSFSLPAAEGPQCPPCPCGLSYLATVGAGLGDAEGGWLCFGGFLGGGEFGFFWSGGGVFLVDFCL